MLLIIQKNVTNVQQFVLDKYDLVYVNKLDIPVSKILSTYKDETQYSVVTTNNETDIELKYNIYSYENHEDDDPEVSIICCLYNTPTKLFKNAIESMIGQTFKNFECIVMNDGSDKYIEENIQYLVKLNDPRIKVHHKHHDGKSNTFNESLKISKGKYITVWDSDDSFKPNRIEYQVNKLKTMSIDCISNCMIDSNNYVWPTNQEPSQFINMNNVHYLPLHPCQTFKKDKVLDKIPYLFEQIYDSTEDSLFNHNMFFHGVKMYFDKEILGYYCLSNPDAAHFDNFKPYLKYCTENLRYKKFKNDPQYTDITCILIVNSNWGTELEKSLLNIRLTSENVNIVVAAYSKLEEYDFIDQQTLDFYGCTYITGKSYVDVLNKSIEICNTTYMFVLSQPIRFCVEHWDYKIYRFVTNLWSNEEIIQPIMFDMEKVNDNYYLNERGKYEKHNVRYGECLTLLSNSLSEKITYHFNCNDYTNWFNIPLLDNELVFFCKKEVLKDILKLNFVTDDLLNIYISLKQYNNGRNILLFDDIQCSIERINTEHDDNQMIYNFVSIVKTFFRETQIVYEHIIHQLFGENGIEIWNNITGEELEKLNLQNFYKNINHKQPWII